MIRTVPPVVARAANSEVRAVTSVRTNWLIAAVVVLAGVIAFTALGFGYQPGVGKENGFSAAGGWAVPLVGVALVLAVAGSAAFGALGIGSEYRYGSMTLGSLYTPDRNLLLGSKLAVAGGFSLGTVLVMELLGGAGMRLSGGSKVPMDGGFAGVLIGLAVAALCWGVIGASLGFVLRSPVQALAAVAALAILEPLVWITARAIGFGGIAAILPVSSTVAALSAGRYAKSNFFAPSPAAAAILLLWAAAAGAAAWWSLTTREL